MSAGHEVLLSVVIPVHNGERFIRKTVKNILKQSYQNLEIILVENNSRDDSWNVVCQLQQMDNRVRAVQSMTLGTSLARRKGVEEARGKYIVFSDQDDRYHSKTSLAVMVDAIETDQSQICQFNHYEQYRFGLCRKKMRVKQDAIVSREQIMQFEIAGILGTEKNSMFDSVVWSKIYDAVMLKDAVKNIDVSLYFAEDVYLNFWAFTNKNTKKVSARTVGVYAWSTGVGFSSRADSSEALFRDYEQIKPIMLSALAEYGVDEQVIWYNHLETLYSVMNFVCAMINNGTSEAEVVKKIETIDKYQYIQNAKKWIRTNQKFRKWESLEFMARDYTAQEDYDWLNKR